MTGKVIAFRPMRGGVEEMSDEAIVAACASGDTAALGMLFDRFHRDVLRFLSRVLGADCLDLDDLAQATFIEVWRSASRFGRRSSVKSWILAIAHNLARHHVRGEVRRRTALSVLEHRPQRAVRSQEEAVGDQLLVERLAVALRDLDADRRTAFIMCDLEEIPGVDVANALGIRPGTLWRRLHEARKALRRALEEDA
jgi:RNA polymerase sigma-70 factor (ECF subfamily)